LLKNAGANGLSTHSSGSPNSDKMNNCFVRPSYCYGFATIRRSAEQTISNDRNIASFLSFQMYVLRYIFVVLDGSI
jgi:hypothetical protein